MSFLAYLNEGSESMYNFPYKNVRIYWNTGNSNDHTLNSRLERIGKTKKEVYSWLKKFISVLKKENRNYGVYAVIFPDFKMISIYSKDRLFINTFLTKSMGEKDYDFKVQILESLEKFSNGPIENDTFSIIKILKETICVEKTSEYIDIYGMKNSYFDIIEIN